MRTLYFTRGNVPTPEERAEADALGAVLRNAAAWHEGDPVETCDAVAGAYPPPYAARAVRVPEHDAPADAAPARTRRKGGGQ